MKVQRLTLAQLFSFCDDVAQLQSGLDLSGAD